jgi:AraC-like DNA-binding protein
MPQRKVSWESLHQGLHSVRLLRLRLQAFEGELHAHDALELTLVERGSGLRWVGGRIEPFEAGDLVLLGPRLPHQWHTRGPQPAGAWATVLQLMPTAQLAALPEWRSLTPLLQRAGQGLALEGELHARTVRALHTLPEAPGMALLGGALGLLGELADAPEGLRPLDPVAPQLQPREQPQQRRLEALLAWVQRHLGAELRTADAAALLHVSPAAFSRSFQRLVGRSFTDYVNELRVAEACVQLRRSDRPIAEVAQACGFLTLSHFNAEFRRRTGTTPRAYRLGR